MTKYRNDPKLTADIARSLLDYDPASGHFNWRVAISKMRAGQRAGKLAPGGYQIIKIKKSFYRAHRLAWLHYYGSWPDSEIDHIDGDVANNRIVNLRAATRSENACNRASRGYSYDGRRGKYRPTIFVSGKKVRLGSFISEEDARAAYVAASLKYHGEFSSVLSRGTS